MTVHVALTCVYELNDRRLSKTFSCSLNDVCHHWFFCPNADDGCCSCCCATRNCVWTMMDDLSHASMFCVGKRQSLFRWTIFDYGYRMAYLWMCLNCFHVVGCYFHGPVSRERKNVPIIAEIDNYVFNFHPTELLLLSLSRRLDECDELDLRYLSLVWLLLPRSFDVDELPRSLCLSLPL